MSKLKQVKSKAVVTLTFLVLHGNTTMQLDAVKYFTRRP